MRISPWRLHAIPRDYNSCVGNWMRFKHIYNMYRFAESIRLLFEKIVEKLLFYGGQNFTYCTPANPHMNSNFFLFLIFNLERLPDLEKSRTPHKSEHKCIQVDFYNIRLHVPSTHRMRINPWRLHCIRWDYNSYLDNWMRFKHIYNMYRFIASIRLLYAKFVKNLYVYAGQNFSFCCPENQHISCNFFLLLIYNPHNLPDLRKKRTPQNSEQKWIQVDFYPKFIRNFMQESRNYVRLFVYAVQKRNFEIHEAERSHSIYK